MKPITLLSIALGFWSIGQAYALDIFTPVSVKPERIQQDAAFYVRPSVTYRGTYQANQATDGRQLATFTNTNSQAGSFWNSLPLSGTFTPDLKPSNSDIPHGANDGGYIEQIWGTGLIPYLADSQSALFATEIYPSRSNYLYKEAYGSVGNDYSASTFPNYTNKQAVLNLGERSGIQANIRPLHQRSLLSGINDATTGARVLYYGDYYNNDGKVTLWKSTDAGTTWNKFIEWDTQGHPTRHINAVIQNPYNQWIYILFGDDATESAIVAWDGTSATPPDNTPLDQIGNFPGWKAITGAAARTGDLLFMNGKCIWLPEVDPTSTQPIYGQRANFDLSNWETTGEVPYTEGLPPVIGTASNGTLYWASYRDQTAAENKIAVWKSIDEGLNWSLAGKADVFATETATPLQFSATADFVDPSASNTLKIDNLTLTGRALDFVPGGQKIGSTAVFNVKSTIPEVLPVTNADTYSFAYVTNSGAFTLGIHENDTGLGNGHVIIKTPASHGTVTIDATAPGFVNYTPNPGFTGVDTFTYVLQNSVGTSNESTVTINMTAPPPPVVQVVPVTSPDKITGIMGQEIQSDLSVNDTNLQNLWDSELLIVGQPQHGTIGGTNGPNVSYNPNVDFGGIDTFSYAFKNLAGTSNTSKVTVYVLNAKNDNYAFTADGNKTQTFCKSASDGVAQNDLPRITKVPGITYGFNSADIFRQTATSTASVSISSQATNGSFCFTLNTPQSANTGNKRLVSKRGLYQVNYTMSLNGVSERGNALITVK